MNVSYRWLSAAAVMLLGLELTGIAQAGTPSEGGQAVNSAERRVQGHLTIEGVPEKIPAALAERLNQYSNVRSASAAGWDPSGRGILVYSRLGQTTQLYRVGAPKHYREQLTFFEEPVRSVLVNPDSSRNEMVLLKDVGGSENYQIYLQSLKDGSCRMLTDGKARYGSVVWSADGKQIAYQSTLRNGSDWDIWIMDPHNPSSARMVCSPGGYWCVLDWSADGSKLLLYKYVSITDSSMAVFDIKTGKMLPVGVKEKTGTVAMGEQALFGRDGRGAFFTTDAGSEFQRLAWQDFSTGKISYMAPDVKGDITEMRLSKDGNTLIFASSEDAVNHVYAMDLRRGACRIRRIEGLPEGVLYGMELAPGGRLAVSIGGGSLPCDTYVVDLQNGDKCERWTFSEIGGLDEASFIAPKLIRYPTFDKADGKVREIPAFCYMPKLQEGRKCPVMIYIHGGPESQYQPYFSSLIQYMVCEKGIAVIAPNVRGSYGYGKTYVSLDNGYKREDSVKDIGALIEWIKQQPQFSDRIAVMGGSYGGYMTLAAMTHFSADLSCGIDNVGISNFVTFLENTNPNRQDLRRVEYGDERDPKMRAFMQEIAPANNASKITKPLYVVQGYNDPRVPVTEAEQMVREIRKAGGQVWYLCADDEGHGFAKKPNRDYYWQSAILFLEKYLLAE